MYHDYGQSSFGASGKRNTRPSTMMGFVCAMLVTINNTSHHKHNSLTAREQGYLFMLPTPVIVRKRSICHDVLSKKLAWKQVCSQKCLLLQLGAWTQIGRR